MTLPIDKITHFLTGFFIAVWFPLYWTVPAALVAGTLKELYDLKTYGKFDWTDWACTLSGGVAGAFYLLAIHHVMC
jgi:hypothetical protein